MGAENSEAFYPVACLDGEDNIISHVHITDDMEFTLCGLNLEAGWEEIDMLVEAVGAGVCENCRAEAGPGLILASTGDMG